MKLICAKAAAFKYDPGRRLLYQRKISTRDISGLRIRKLIDQNHLCTESAHHASAFLRIAFGHNGDKWVAFDGADDRKSRACVAARQLYNGLPRLKCSISFSVLDNLTGN